ncbi:hypothetical protein [Phycicoccus avicenniae]|uniref:hypothetical protein n=1 Tax=Phycicoccus avicenniae TaxID=2828860 RepID=UPI003D2B16B3
MTASPTTGAPTGSSTPATTEDPRARLRDLVGALHDRLGLPCDGAGRRSRLLRAAAGGPDSLVVRVRRPAGWLTAVGLALAAWGFVAQLVMVYRFAGEGGADLLAGRLPTLLAVAALGMDLLARLNAEPRMAVGRAGVALRVSDGTADLVPWSDVASVVQLHGVHPTAPDLVELGVRLRRPLPQPHAPGGGARTHEAERLGLGTELLTRPVDPLTGRRRAALVEAVARHSPGTAVEDRRA